MKGADDDVKGDPGDEEPAGPVVAVEHEDAGDDLQKAREMNVPVALDVRSNEAANKRDTTEDYEEPTDDRDREWASWHAAHRLHWVKSVV